MDDIIRTFAIKMSVETRASFEYAIAFCKEFAQSLTTLAPSDNGLVERRSPELRRADMLTKLDAKAAAKRAERSERVQAAFDVFKGKNDTGPNATALFEYIEQLEAECTALIRDNESYVKQAADLATENERLKAEADGEFVEAAIRVMQSNPGFDARDYSLDGITADDFETFFTEDMNEAWNQVDKWKTRAETAEARLSALEALLDKAVAKRCAEIADDLSKDELFLDDKGRFGAELTAATIRNAFGLDATSSQTRVTKIDGGYLHEWIDADGEHHKYVHPTNLSAPPLPAAPTAIKEARHAGE